MEAFLRTGTVRIITDPESCSGSVLFLSLTNNYRSASSFRFNTIDPIYSNGKRDGLVTVPLYSFCTYSTDK